MGKARFFVPLLLLCLWGVGGIHAQEGGGGGISPDSDWEIYAPEFYSRGDQTFIISVGVMFPTVFVDSSGNLIDHNFSPPIGGTGSLAYNYFLGSHVSLGGEIGGMFSYTAGESTVFIIPIGFRAGYQFVVRRFEFPLTLTVGFAPQRYLNLGYFGFFAKGGGSVYFRFSPEWSFGVNTNWFWLPQWTRDPAKDVQGNMVDLTIGFRYHF
jgi:hypothetical protein